MRARTAARIAAAALLAAALAGCSLGQEPQARSAPAPVTAVAPQANASAQAATAGDIPAIVRKVEPSVVTIFVDNGLGSGVVWARDGTVVTNHHVVESAGAGGQVEVAFADGRRVDGRVRASDPITDLAVVQADRKDVPPATFQRSLPVVGELAVAIGSPLGLENTVTAGIISGLHREIPEANQPSVVDLVGQLLKDGRASHAFLGITPQAITPEIADRLGLDRTTGVLVLTAESGGPAADAGIRPGDVLTRMGNRELEGVEDLLDELRQHKAGDRVQITLVRGGRTQQVEVTLAERPPG